MPEDVLFPLYYLRLATSCVLGPIYPASFLECATCNPFLHLPLTAPGAGWPKLFCCHLWDESVLCYFLRKFQAHKSSHKRGFPSALQVRAFCSRQPPVQQQVGERSAPRPSPVGPFLLEAAQVCWIKDHFRYHPGCAKAPNLPAYLQTHLSNM